MRITECIYPTAFGSKPERTRYTKVYIILSKFIRESTTDYVEEITQRSVTNALNFIAIIDDGTLNKNTHIQFLFMF